MTGVTIRIGKLAHGARTWRNEAKGLSSWHLSRSPKNPRVVLPIAKLLGPLEARVAFQRQAYYVRFTWAVIRTTLPACSLRCWTWPLTAARDLFRGERQDLRTFYRLTGRLDLDPTALWSSIVSQHGSVSSLRQR